MNLQWTYEESKNSSTIIANSSINPIAKDLPINTETVTEPSPAIALPPHEDLAILLDLARKGILKNLVKKLDNLEQQDEKLIPFTSELRHLASGFQIKKLQDLLQQYTDQSL